MEAVRSWRSHSIAFYRTHWEPAFTYAKLLVADRTGASAIIGAKDGQLQVQEENQSRGFGFGWQTLDLALAKRPKPTVAHGFKILRDCRQGGYHTTKLWVDVIWKPGTNGGTH